MILQQLSLLRFELHEGRIIQTVLHGGRENLGRGAESLWRLVSMLVQQRLEIAVVQVDS
jgi:hypothetical protein